jgi:hypothetical protein
MPRAPRWCLRSLALVAAGSLVACGGGGTAPTPTVEATATATSSAEVTAAATVDATSSAVPPVAAETVDAALTEVVEAVRTAEAVVNALDEADTQGVWDPVTEACRRYPTLAPNPGSSLASTAGLWTQAGQPALWPTAVVELDETSATACFLVAAAHEIPPDARIDAEAPTTAEIVARPLQAALAAIDPRDEAALRLLIEQHS